MGDEDLKARIRAGGVDARYVSAPDSLSPQELGDYEADKKASRAFVKAKAASVEAASTPIIPQEELGEILHEFASWFPWRPEDLKAHHYEKAEEEAKSAINSLTLKQVLSLIGEDDKSVIEDDVAGEWCSTCETDINGVESPNPCQCDIKNALRAELRQSAERLYG